MKKPLNKIKKRTDIELSPRAGNRKYDIIKKVEKTVNTNKDTNSPNEEMKYNITWKDKDSER